MAIKLKIEVKKIQILVNPKNKNPNKNVIEQKGKIHGKEIMNGKIK